VSTRSLRAPIQERRGTRRRDWSRGRAWRARSPRAVGNCGWPATLRRRWRSGSRLRGRKIGGVAFQQSFAAHAMQFCYERAMARAVGRRQRLVEDADGAVGIARLGFRLGAIFNSPSKTRMFCLRANSAPRRMFSSPLPIARRTSLNAFGAARARSPRIIRDCASRPKSGEASIAQRMSGLTEWFAGEFCRGARARRTSA
jgi:hypothetical protein